MSYQVEASTEDCYPGTTVLVNKLGIQNEAEISAIEAEFVSVRSVQWALSPLANAFDFAHYKTIHAYLFGDIYDWAGKIRTVNLSKKGTNFGPAEEIGQRAVAIFERLKANNFLCGLSHDRFIEELVDFYCATNELHPFREGNGRTQRLFLTQLIENAGYQIHFSELDGDLFMIATIQAAQGVTDFRTNETNIRKMLSRARRKLCAMLEEP